MRKGSDPKHLFSSQNLGSYQADIDDKQNQRQTKEAKHRHFKVQFIQEIKIINLEGTKLCAGRREGENAKYDTLCQVREAL